MVVNVGINGFGRIGRNLFRAVQSDPSINLVALNDLADTRTLAHLLKHDSVLGEFAEDVSANSTALKIGGREVRIFSERTPSAIDWTSAGVDLVIEATGHFTCAEDARKHLRESVRKVIVAAPASGEDITIVLGVNEAQYDPHNHHVISNASCTTNCIAPVAKAMQEQFGIRAALVTTIHSYTNGQQLLDLPHKDLRRARAAMLSMIPTSTSAARIVPLVLPELQGKFHAISVRVPTPNVSMIDLIIEVEKVTSAENVNAALKHAAESDLRGIIACSDESLVSVDFRRNPHSSIIDAKSTKVTGGKMVKIVAWYDNEWGYSCRVRDLIKYIVAKGQSRSL